jgi:hypothetical protein
VQLWAFSDKTPNVILLHAWLARLGVIITSIVGLMSVRLGWSTTADSRRRSGKPSGLAFGGLLLSSAAFLLWEIAGLGLLNTTESLLLNIR